MSVRDVQDGPAGDVSGSCGLKRPLVLPLGFLAFGALILSACVVTAPAKGIWHTGKFAGKSVYYSGKGVYQVGRLTVKAADGVLDGTERMLRLTILTADAAGSVARTTREINALALEAELAALERTDGVLEVIVERVETRATDWAGDRAADEAGRRLDEWAGSGDFK